MTRRPSVTRALHQLDRHRSGTPNTPEPEPPSWAVNLAAFNTANIKISARVLAGLDNWGAAVRGGQETTRPAQFRWRRYDSPDEEWSKWHQLVTGNQKCPACCCPSGGLLLGGIPALCDCGAREHQEPAEAMTFWDTDHIRACQGCDLNDSDVPTEQRAEATP